MAALRPRWTLSPLTPSWEEDAGSQLQNRHSAWRSARGVMFLAPLAASVASLPEAVLLLFYVQFRLLLTRRPSLLPPHLRSQSWALRANAVTQPQ